LKTREKAGTKNKKGSREKASPRDQSLVSTDLLLPASTNHYLKRCNLASVQFYLLITSHKLDTTIKTRKYCSATMLSKFFIVVFPSKKKGYIFT
jgi:hypothetical protein